MYLLLGLVLFVAATLAVGAVRRHTIRVLRRRSLARLWRREAAAQRATLPPPPSDTPLL